MTNTITAKTAMKCFHSILHLSATGNGILKAPFPAPQGEPRSRYLR